MVYLFNHLLLALTPQAKDKIDINNNIKDAYFQIAVKLNGKIIGYYEHNYGKYELIYRDLR